MKIKVIENPHLEEDLVVIMMAPKLFLDYNLAKTMEDIKDVLENESKIISYSDEED